MAFGFSNNYQVRVGFQVKSHADSVDVHGAENAKSMDLAALKVNIDPMSYK